MLKEHWQRNLAVLWLAQTLMMMAFSFFFPFIPLYVQTLGVQGTAQAAQWAGLLSAASAISMAIVQPIWGNLADRFGRKPMVVRSMVSAGILTSLMGLATSPEQLLVLRFLQGALSGSVSAANAMVASTTPRERLGYALGVMQVALFVGSSLGPLAGGLVADSFGHRSSFFISGVGMIAGGAVVILFAKERFARPPAGGGRRSVLKESRSLLALPTFPILIVVIFMIQLGVMVISPVLSLYVAELGGPENAATAAGVVLGASGAVSAASALTIGRVSDRIGARVILPICLLGAAAAYLPQAFIAEVWQLLLLRMLLGVFLGGLMPSANALVARLVPQERRGAAFGLTATASSLANAIGPLSAGAVTTRFGVRAVFLSTGLLFAASYVWASIGLRRQARASAPAGQAGKAESSGA